MKKILIIIGITVILIGSALFAGYRFLEKNYEVNICGAGTAIESDADIYRLKHLKYYAELIEEFRQKTGEYPLQGVVPYSLYVNVAREGQPIFHDEDGVTYQVWLFPEFVSELERGLGRSINQHFDPLDSSRCIPNNYIYLIYGDTFFFTVHTNQDFSFGKKFVQRAPTGYHKVEVTNKPYHERNLFTIEELLANPDFVKEINKTPQDTLLEERDKKLINYTKDLEKDGRLSEVYNMKGW